MDTLLAKHKITVMVQPVNWTSQTQRTVINSDAAGGNVFSTDIQDRNIDMSYVENVTNQVALSYFMPGQSNDLMIVNWQDRMENLDAPTMDSLTTLDEQMFFDTDHYSTYFETLVWGGDVAVPEYDGTDIALSLSPVASETHSFSIDIDALYNDPVGFTYLNLPFAISNISDISEMKVLLHDGSQSIQVFEKTFVADDSDQFFMDCFSDLAEIAGSPFKPVEIIFEITYKSEIESSESSEDPIFYLVGLGLFHAESVGNLEILIDNEVTEINEVLYPTIYNSEMAPWTQSFEFNVTEDPSEKTLNSIRIVTPSASYTEMTLYSFSMSHYNTNTTYSEATYSYNFDPHQVWFETLLMSFYVPDIAYAPWTTTQASPIIRDNIWTYSSSFDFDGDMTYDLRLQWFDGEGKGSEIFDTLDDGTEVSYFENGIKDTLLWDFGVDGNWNFMQKWDDVISVYNVTELEAYGSDYHYISRSEYQYYEEAYDLSGDGIFNYYTRIYRSRSFQQFYEVETEIGKDIRRRTSIPNYRENFVREDDIDGFGFENYFQENTTSLDWTEWIEGFTITQDLDGDGLFEESVDHKNLFADSFEDLLENHIEFIYETYIYEKSWEEEIRNISDTSQILDVRVVSEKTQSNMLLENATFLLLGADSSLEWRETGMDDNNITGEFVFEYDVPVVIDPRTNVPNCMRVDDHGVLAWFDSQNDGFYEMAFVFTEESWEDGIAVSVYISQSGRSEVITDRTLFKLSGDDVIPTHWLSQDYDYADIMDISWDNAWNEFKDQLSNSEFLLMMGIDTLSTAGIMFATSAMMSGLTALTLATSWVPIVGAIFMAGAFLAYQFWLRPIIEDTLAFFGAVADKGRELGKDADHPLIDVLSFDLSYGWESLTDEATLFKANEINPTYTENIYFMDVNPFEFDTGAESWFDWVGWNEDNVYAQYQVPQFWEPQAQEGNFGSELLYAFDIFAALERMNLFNPEYHEPNTDYEFDLDDLNDIPHDIDLGGTAYWDSGAGWITYPTAFVNDLKINGDAHIYAAEHNYYELYLDITPDTDVSDVLKKIWWDRMYNQEAYQRRAFHQYFYRTPTNSTWDLWDQDDPQYESYVPLDEIGRVTAQIADNSVAGYAAVEYATGENGQPMLIATYETTMNYTNPVVEEVDYNIMCLISKYRTGYIAGNDYNMDIFLINLQIQAVQTAIGIAAGFAGSGFGTALKTGASKFDCIKNAFSESSFMGEMMEEMVKEALWAETAKFVGIGDLLAEQIGEFMGGFGVAQHITGVSLKEAFVNVDNVKQFIKTRQALKQYETNINLVKDGVKTALTLGEIGLLSADQSAIIKATSSAKPFTKKDQFLLAQAIGGKTDNLGEMIDRIQELIIYDVVARKINLAKSKSIIEKIEVSNIQKFDNLQVSERAFTLTYRAAMAIEIFAGGNNIKNLLNNIVLQSLGGITNGRYMYLRFASKDGSAIEIDFEGKVTQFRDGVQLGESFNIYDPATGQDFCTLTDLLEKYDAATLVDPVKDKSADKKAVTKKIFTWANIKDRINEASAAKIKTINSQLDDKQEVILHKLRQETKRIFFNEQYFFVELNQKYANAIKNKINIIQEFLVDQGKTEEYITEFLKKCQSKDENFESDHRFPLELYIDPVFEQYLEEKKKDVDNLAHSYDLIALKSCGDIILAAKDIAEEKADIEDYFDLSENREKINQWTLTKLQESSLILRGITKAGYLVGSKANVEIRPSTSINSYFESFQTDKKGSTIQNWLTKCQDVSNGIQSLQTTGNFMVIDSLLKTISSETMPKSFQEKGICDIFDLLFDPVLLDTLIPSGGITYRQLLFEAQFDITGSNQPLWDIISDPNVGTNELSDIISAIENLGITAKDLNSLSTFSHLPKDTFQGSALEEWKARAKFRTSIMKMINEKMENFIAVLSIKSEPKAMFTIGRTTDLDSAASSLSFYSTVAAVININVGSEIFQIKQSKKGYYYPVISNLQSNPDGPVHFSLDQLQAVDSFIQYIIDEFFAGNTEDYQQYLAFIQSKYFKKQPSYDLTSDNFESFAINQLNPTLDPKKALYAYVTYPDGTVHKIKCRSKGELRLAKLLSTLPNLEILVGDELTAKDHRSNKILIAEYEYEGKKYEGFLDFVLTFRHGSALTGILFEYLGFDKTSKYKNPKTGEYEIYGPKKDALCEILVELGFPPVYVVESANFKYYKESAKHIGHIAPLLSTNHIKVLVDILIRNPDIPLKNLIQRLTADDGLQLGDFLPSAEILTEIQKAFGFVDGEFQDAFEDWWDNVNDAPQNWIIDVYREYSNIIGNP
ncbi:MAG: hypothetical protein ACTSYI_12035 [Promethearchaeota archaeon]